MGWASTLFKVATFVATTESLQRPRSWVPPKALIIRLAIAAAGAVLLLQAFTFLLLYLMILLFPTLTVLGLFGLVAIIFAVAAFIALLVAESYGRERVTKRHGPTPVRLYEAFRRGFEASSARARRREAFDRW